MARLQEHFNTTRLPPSLIAKFGYKSIMEVPRLTKITLNMGVSRSGCRQKKVMDNAVPI